MKRTSLTSTVAMLFLFGAIIPAYAQHEGHDQQGESEKHQRDQPSPQEQQQRTNANGQRDQRAPQQQQDRNQAAQAKPNNQQLAKAQQNQENRQRDQNAQHHQRETRSVQQEQQDQNKWNNQQQQQAKQQQDQRQRQQQSQKSEQQRSPAQVHRQQAAWESDRAHDWQSQHRTWQQRGGYNGYRVPSARFHEYYGRDHQFLVYNLPVTVVGGHRRFQYGGYWFGLSDPWPEYWSNDWYDRDDVYVDYYGDGYYLYNTRYPGDRIAITFYLK